MKRKRVTVMIALWAVTLATGARATEEPPGKSPAGSESAASRVELRPVGAGAAASSEPDHHPPRAGKDEADSRRTPEASRGWLAQKYMTGDWGGVRTDLGEAGIDFTIQLMNQLMVNMHGGLETRNGHDTAGSYQFDVTFDFEKMKLIEGGSFFMRAKGTWGGDDSDFDREKIGGLFRTNQDARPEEVLFVDKWHYRQMFFDKKVELRLGRLRPTKDYFDTSRVMGHEDLYFLNQALSLNPLLPSDKMLGAYVNWEITKEWYVRALVGDAQSQDRQTNFNTAFHEEDWFRLFAEAGWRPKFDSPRGKLWGHYRLGTHYDPNIKRRNFNTLGGRLATRLDTGDWGFYTGFDQMVWKENPDEKDMQGLTIAGRYGWADGEVNRFDNFWAAAIQYEGIVPDRNKDVLAFGVAQGILADEYRRVHPRADRETVYELYYLIYLGPWLQVTPTFQYIHQAGGDEDDNDAAVFGLRVRMLL